MRAHVYVCDSQSSVQNMYLYNPLITLDMVLGKFWLPVGSIEEVPGDPTTLASQIAFLRPKGLTSRNQNRG